MLDNWNTDNNHRTFKIKTSANRFGKSGGSFSADQLRLMVNQTLVAIEKTTVTTYNNARHPI